MIMKTLPVTTVGGTRLRVEGMVRPHARAWKQRPSVVLLGGFGTDNCTGVSAEERRHL